MEELRTWQASVPIYVPVSARLALFAGNWWVFFFCLLFHLRVEERHGLIWERWMAAAGKQTETWSQRGPRADCTKNRGNPPPAYGSESHWPNPPCITLQGDTMRQKVRDPRSRRWDTWTDGHFQRGGKREETETPRLSSPIPSNTPCRTTPTPTPNQQVTDSWSQVWDHEVWGREVGAVSAGQRRWSWEIVRGAKRHNDISESRRRVEGKVNLKKLKLAAFPSPLE